MGDAAVGLTKVDSVEESESPTKSVGRTARLRMSFHSTLPQARSISRSRSKSGDGSISGATYGTNLLPPGSGPVSPTAPVPVHNSSSTITNQIRKVMSLESGVGPGNHVGGGGDEFHAQSVPVA